MKKREIFEDIMKEMHGYDKSSQMEIDENGN